MPGGPNFFAKVVGLYFSSSLALTDALRAAALSGGNASERPVFIVGMPRSGTTLTAQIRASHPAVFGAGELTFWQTAATAYEATHWPRCARMRKQRAAGGNLDDARASWKSFWR